VNGLEMMNLAQWDGSSWAPVGGGVNWDGAFDLASFREWLVVAGEFYIAGILGGPAASVRNITAWNGTSWNQMEMGTTKTVYALAVWRDRLIAAGKFQEIGSIYTHGRIASWDGTTWSAVPTPHDGGIVRELAVRGDDLYACPGWMTGTGSIVARYDGTTWTPLGGSLPSYWGEEMESPAITFYRNDPILALVPDM
jgi:hypothetical protein